MARNGADRAVAVDEAVVRGIIAAVVPGDKQVLAVGSERNGGLPLVGRRHIVVDGKWIAPGVASVGGHGKEYIGLVLRTLGLVVVNHVDVASDRVDRRLGISVTFEAAAVSVAV